jgi:hypothetical protein
VGRGRPSPLLSIAAKTPRTKSERVRLDFSADIERGNEVGLRRSSPSECETTWRTFPRTTTPLKRLLTTLG